MSIKLSSPTRMSIRVRKKSATTIIPLARSILMPCPKAVWIYKQYERKPQD